MNAKKFYYLYEIQDLVNGKIYVGVHQTDRMDDGYMGSGTALKRAVKERGVEHFRKKVLAYFTSAEDMYKAEAQIVNDDFLLREDVYNLVVGGHGSGFSPSANERRSRLLAENADWRASYVAKLSQAYRFDPCRSAKALATCRHNKLGAAFNDAIRSEMNLRSRSAASRAKRCETFSRTGHQQGSKNSCYGKRWVTNGVVSRLVRAEEELEAGWSYGRRTRRAKSDQAR